MNYQATLYGLPIPNDCVDIINGYLFVDPVVYKNKLIKISIFCIMKSAIHDYNDEIDGYFDERDSNSIWDTFMFRWFYDHIQYQMKFCIKCGNYKTIDNGPLNRCCACKCA